MIDIDTESTDELTTLRVRGGAAADDEAAGFRARWDDVVDALVSADQLAIVVDVRELAPTVEVARALAGWIHAVASAGGWYRLVGASPELRASLAREGAGPGAFFEDVEAALAGPADDAPITIKVDAFPITTRWLVVDDARAEDRALLAHLEANGLAFERITSLYLDGEDLDDAPALAWKLFVGRLWPIEIAAAHRIETFTPRAEAGTDDDGEPYEDDQYNYHVWDDLGPRLANRPLVLFGGRVLVGWNAAIGARLAAR